MTELLLFSMTDFIDIIKNNSFLTERGYVGYANENYGPINIRSWKF